MKVLKNRIAVEKMNQGKDYRGGVSGLARMVWFA